MIFGSIADLRRACQSLPKGSEEAERRSRARQAELTKPTGSLGRLEELAVWMARWQRKERPAVDDPAIRVFAGDHGIANLGVSAYPPAVTEQMIENFDAGGGAINQLARVAGSSLRIVPIEVGTPTDDFTKTVAMSETAFLGAVSAGWDAVPASCDLLAVGEMGIGNTTVAAALCAALLGGGAARWIGRGTGVDDTGMARKRAVVTRGVRRHRAVRHDALLVAAALGGRELAAIMGAVLAARHRSIPVLLDGFVVSAAVLPLHRENPDALDHCMAAHRSSEAAHDRLLRALKLSPLLDLDMRLGEASGAALAILLVRAAVEAHNVMSTFSSAAVSRASTA